MKRHHDAETEILDIGRAASEREAWEAGDMRVTGSDAAANVVGLDTVLASRPLDFDTFETTSPPVSRAMAA